jgi:hypothetical protein
MCDITSEEAIRHTALALIEEIGLHEEMNT